MNHIGGMAADDWNALAGHHNPFLRHEFLLALEESGCASEKTGWIPQHLLIEDDAGKPAAVAPMYLKTHSYGEYVFDWAWADAYQRAGLDYYPKLVSAVPFTPVTGARILTGESIRTQELTDTMAEAAKALAREHGASSLHWLFVTETQVQEFKKAGYLQRTGFQYHWQNRNYQDFEQFLQDFSSAKRKKIRRERRFVYEQGISMQIVTGNDATTNDWDRFYSFYRATILNHGAIAYLSRDFFQRIGETMSANTVLVFAWHNNRPVAGALNLRGNDALFGRYWGSDGHHHSLHFETCYYTAIDYCIANGLSRFEAGAQGSHKLSRGFLPEPTYSAHWLQHPEFSDAIARYLQQEHDGIEYQLNELNEHTPFRRQC